MRNLILLVLYAGITINTAFGQSLKGYSLGEKIITDVPKFGIKTTVAQVEGSLFYYKLKNNQIYQITFETRNSSMGNLLNIKSGIEANYSVVLQVYISEIDGKFLGYQGVKDNVKYGLYYSEFLSGTEIIFSLADLTLNRINEQEKKRDREIKQDERNKDF